MCSKSNTYICFRRKDRLNSSLFEIYRLRSGVTKNTCRYIPFPRFSVFIRFPLKFFSVVVYRLNNKAIAASAEPPDSIVSKFGGFRDNLIIVVLIFPIAGIKPIVSVIVTVIICVAIAGVVPTVVSCGRIVIGYLVIRILLFASGKGEEHKCCERE
ncbi:MAG: hypothetical protein E7626_05510 [Ruminococcaceae bacterium]|nr:hypothetical protein [Oscillospiraceae bacterium]